MRFWARASCLLLASYVGCEGQLAAPATFDAAAIKPTPAGEAGPGWSTAPGARFIAHGLTLRELVAIAYDVQSFQVNAGPGWIRSQRWSIDAKAEEFSGQLTRQELQKPLLSLLADRFRLRSHAETREMPVYILMPAPGGPKLKPAQEPARTVGFGRGFINGRSVDMDLLGRVLETLLEKPVVNQTGITGAYDIYLQWKPEPGEGAALLGANADLPDRDLGSIFTELREKLGLRLESKRAPAQIVVVERAEMASEN